jgi:hypothetical protein
MANYANYLWFLRIHEHEAPSEESFLPEVIEYVWAKWRDKNLRCGQGFLVVFIDLYPMLRYHLIEHDIHSRVVVLH